MANVKGTRKLASTGSAFNAISFLIDNRIKGLVNTAVPVLVKDVDADAGTVSVQPLVAQTDSDGNVLESPVIAGISYSRMQGGIAALKIDPVKGDIGLAVFAQQDCSNIVRGQSAPVQPASFRSYSMADGFYIGGFLNKQPEIWLELTQDNIATLHAPARVIIETGTAEINASSISLTGSVDIKGALNVTGALTAAGDIVAGKTSLTAHIHGGVTSGLSVTSVPQ